MEHFLLSVGYPAIFILAVVEAACIPFPSEVTFAYSGFLVSQHHLSLAPVLIVGIVGEVLGSFVGYFIGRTGGRALVDRYGKYVLLTHRDLERMDRFLARRGDSAVFFGRVLPLLRTFAALVAGLGEAPIVKFGIFTTLATAIYCTVLTLVGDSLGAEWNKLVKGFTDASIVLGVLVVAVIALALAHRWRDLRAERGGAQS